MGTITEIPGPWEQWFAWRPVSIPNPDDTAWLFRVWRRRVGYVASTGSAWSAMEYRRINWPKPAPPL